MGVSGATASSNTFIVELALDQDGRPVGFVESGPGRRVAITGWLGLVSELTQRLSAPEAAV